MQSKGSEVAKQFESQYMKNYFKIPIDVHHCVESYKIPIYTHPDFASIAIAGYLMNYVFLHPLIREQGGAYGSGSNVNESGIFSFYSFRDPHIKNTYQAFSQSLSQIINGKFTDTDIKEAKLLAFSKIDKPLAQSDEGMLVFSRNYTNQERQNLREQLLDVTKESIVECANKYLLKEQNAGRASRVVVGKEEPNMDELKEWACMSPLAFISKGN
jgi:Zn-dependent M16 (insulinase) family peptidase